MKEREDNMETITMEGDEMKVERIRRRKGHNNSMGYAEIDKDKNHRIKEQERIIRRERERAYRGTKIENQKGREDKRKKEEEEEKRESPKLSQIFNFYSSL